MKISVVTVTYNCRNVIEKTICSVLFQTSKDIEYLIVDGGSTDGTCEILSKYKDKIDLLISEPDNGIYDAMNKAINLAYGDYILFMNAGDVFHSPHSLELFSEKIDNDTIIAYGDIIKVGKGYRYLDKPSSLKKMSSFMTVFHQSTLTRLDYHKTHLFDLKYKSSADYNFFYQAYLRDRVKFQYIPEVLADFDCCDGTSNVNYKRSQRESLHLRGMDNNWFVRIKLELWMLSVDLKRFIKHNFLSENQIRDIEIARLKREGIKNINIVPFD